MIFGRAIDLVCCPRSGRVNAHSTLAFAAIGDHARMPSRFFARLFASDGSLALR
jgi:hypothetical protein